MLIDSHCHLHDREFFAAEQAEEMLMRAREAGVEKIICIGTSHEDSLAARDFAMQHDNVYWTYGIHPESAGLVTEPIFSDAGLENSSTSYTGTRAEPSLRDEPVRSVRNIRLGLPNLKQSQKSNFSRPVNISVRLRHRAPLIPAKFDGTKLYFENKIKRPASGQSAVLYDGEICLGGGIIA